jgi:hypothetical protein
MGSSRTCADRWWARYRQLGPAGLVDRPSSAHHHPRRTPTELEAQVLALRQTRKLGPARIAPLVGLSASTVYRVLHRHWVNRLAVLDRPTGRVIRRYERDRPGELLHLDVKKLGRLRPVAATASMAATRPSTVPATRTAGGDAAPATTSGAAQRFVERGSCCLQGAGRGDCSRSVSARNQQPVTVAASGQSAAVAAHVG